MPTKKNSKLSLEESMVSDLVNEIDYDIWKGMFDEECMEDPEEAMAHRVRLIEIVEKHLPKLLDRYLENMPRSCEG